MQTPHSATLGQALLSPSALSASPKGEAARNPVRRNKVDTEAASSRAAAWLSGSKAVASTAGTYRSRARARPSADSTGQGSMGCEATRPCPVVLGPETQLVGARGTVATGLSPRCSLGARSSHSSVQWEFRNSAPTRGLNIRHTDLSSEEGRSPPRQPGGMGQGAQHTDTDALDQGEVGARCGLALAGSMRRPAAQWGPHRRHTAPCRAAPNTAPPGL